MATTQQKIERDLSAGQRRALADGASIDVTGTPHLTADCGNCLHPNVYWVDLDGIWGECACDGGYLS
jgi:hypothetical protein